MKMLASAIVTLLMSLTPVSAQLLSREYSNPSVPSRAALDRVNLEMAWRRYLPVEGRRDGIFSIQQLDQKQMMVQTVSGVIVALEADTGVLQWKTRVGNPYQATQPLGFNPKQIFAVRGDRVFAIDRATGRTLWRFIMPTGASAAPLADEYGLYLSLANGRIYAYELPDLVQWNRSRKDLEKRSEFNSAKSVSQDPYGGSSGINLEALAEQRKDVGPEPDLAWEYLFEAGRIALAPLQTSEALVFATANGWIFSTSKFEQLERFRFQAEAPMSAPLGQHGDTAYVASEDYNVYAVAIKAGRILWRFTSGAPILQQPAVTDKDVFVVSDRRGLFRVNRSDGKVVWRNTTAQRFLAANPKFVYAADRIGRLLVLDYARGTQLGTLPTRDFVVPVRNELNDRIYLAAHNGLLVCLHDHNLKVPAINKTIVEKKVEGFKKDDEKKKATDEKKKVEEKKKPKDDEDEDKPKEEKKKPKAEKKKPKDDE
jgi:outer membrane protein assembly factor BamB